MTIHARGDADGPRAAIIVGVHHLRLSLNAPPAERERLACELEARGATRLQATEPLGLVWSTDGSAPVLEELSAGHPTVVVGVERFESLGDELLRAIVHGGVVTVLERRSILDGPHGEGPLEWGVCMDEDGELLDGELLRATAELVAAMPAPSSARGSRTPLHGMVELSRALGRLCATTEDPLAPGAPHPATLSALLELANLALTLGAPTASMCAAEARVARAWCLSRACAHAGVETLWDTPGAASWPDWLATLAASASEAIDAGCHHPIDLAPQAVLLASEHWASPQEQFEAAAATLLVSCLQALALFGATGQAGRA
ncbi:MAG: hypothetical protein MSC31_14935 [Solirubrobacteraceae bacterium MAG38_C4-C5]|nr:hypothetical protein [Candidatus Siliceabacter maunaloa]